MNGPRKPGTAQVFPREGGHWQAGRHASWSIFPVWSQLWRPSLDLGRRYPDQGPV